MRLNKPLDEVTEADLQELVASGVAERKTLEYKSMLPGSKDDDRREFFADVSSFANASGGFLFYGIEEDGGVPTQLVGVEMADPDATILGLENAVRDGIRPRLTLATAAVPIASGKVILIMHIPRSYAAPHMVTFKNWSRFFTRNSKGKYPLDVDELRAAFVRSETVAKRMRDFRRERLARLLADETPVPMQAGAKIVLHLVPFSAFDSGMRHDVSVLDVPDADLFGRLAPLYSGIGSHRYTFEGFLTSATSLLQPTHGYVQVYRSGILESVDASLLFESGGRGKVIPHVMFERELAVRLPAYFFALRSLGVELPIAVMLSLIGVDNYTMTRDLARAFREEFAIDRDVLDVPEVIIEDYAITTANNAAALLRPAFDAVWNACGAPCSMNFDQDGNWQVPV